MFGHHPELQFPEGARQAFLPLRVQNLAKAKHARDGASSKMTRAPSRHIVSGTFFEGGGAAITQKRGMGKNSRRSLGLFYMRISA